MIEYEKELIASLPKTYEPQAVEDKWYRFWEEGGYFKPSGDSKQAHLCHQYAAAQRDGRAAPRPRHYRHR